jgi:undecaprenyl-diphosphatase
LLLLIGSALAADRAVFKLARKPLAREWTIGSVRTAREFGEPVGIAFIAIAVFTLDRQRRRLLVPLVAAIVLASVTATGLKALVGRERPRVTDGATILRGPQAPWQSDFDPSFPSGHTAAAFALAYGLGQLYPRAARLCALYAMACGLSRILDGSHFLSDVLAGAWLGWEVARLAWWLFLPRANRDALVVP